MDFGELDFPNLAHGDVKLVLGAARIYQVESVILRAATATGRAETEDDLLEGGLPVFVALLEPGRAAKLSQKAMKRGVTTRYHIVATGLRTDERGSFMLQLEPVQLNDEGKSIGNVRPYLDRELAQRTPVVFDAFTAILGSLYGKPIDLGGPEEPLPDRIAMAAHVIDLAENLGVKYHIAQEVVTALKQTPEGEGPTVYNAISYDPVYWLEFATRIRSHELFREALIHAAGRFQTTKLRETASHMSEENYELAEIKSKDIKERLKNLFQNILSYYPPELHRQAYTGYADTDNIGRNSYGNDIFSWMALTAFRHCISQEVITALDGEDMGYDLISKIRKGGDHYLSSEDIEPFYGVFPMSNKAREVVERKIKEIKDHVKTWTETLLENESAINTETQTKVYFTCTKVNGTDYPFDEVERSSSEENERRGPFEEDSGSDDAMEVDEQEYSFKGDGWNE